MQATSIAEKKPVSLSSAVDEAFGHEGASVTQSLITPRQAGYVTIANLPGRMNLELPYYYTATKDFDHENIQDAIAFDLVELPKEQRAVLAEYFSTTPGVIVLPSTIMLQTDNECVLNFVLTKIRDIANQSPEPETAPA